MIATFYCVRAKRDYGNPDDWGHFPAGAYLTKREMKAGFKTARLFTTAGKVSQNAKTNAKTNAYVPTLLPFEDWFEIVPVEVQEPA